MGIEINKYKYKHQRDLLLKLKISDKQFSSTTEQKSTKSANCSRFFKDFFLICNKHKIEKTKINTEFKQ